MRVTPMLVVGALTPVSSLVAGDTFVTPNELHRVWIVVGMPDNFSTVMPPGLTLGAVSLNEGSWSWFDPAAEVIKKAYQATPI